MKRIPSDLRIFFPRTLGERKAKVMVICTLMVLMVLVTVGFISAQKQVTVEVDSKALSLKTSKATVGECLKDAHITLGDKDEVKPGLSAAIQDNMTIRVYRITEKLETKRIVISNHLERREDTNLPQGQIKIVESGNDGIKERTIKSIYVDDKLSKKEVIDEKVIQEPVNKVVAVGIKKLSAPSNRVIKTSRGDFRYRRVIKMNASAYAPDPRCTGKYGGKTATGMRARYGVVAVDRGVIPLGTRLYIEGYGHAIAGDVGSAIRGNRIDLCFDNYHQALRFGRRTMSVYILE